MLIRSNIPACPVIFVSGIDTDAGKTYATAWLASQLQSQGVATITQKFLQTGCIGSSEDVVRHRQLCGIGEQPVDRMGLTAPVIFTYPASTQLAARIDRSTVDLNLVTRATDTLLESYDTVLLEGAGGLMVPITDDILAIDYVAEHRYPVALVTNSVLGSINHTLLSLEALLRRDIPLHSILYNTWFDNRDTIIANDTFAYLRRWLDRNAPDTPLLRVPSYPLIDRSL